MALFGKKKTENKKDESKKPAVKPAPAKTDAKPAVAPSMKDLYSGVAPASVGAGETSAKSVKKAGRSYRVLIKPLVTEKASVLGSLNKYVFNVAASANKIEVSKAIYEVYGVKPVSVNMVKVLGKHTRFGRTSGKRKDWKKAIITLPEGKTIKVYEGV